ncbi:hypothetical protein SGUI_0541 [Serinicoccus hydrothermalis]|uniref:Polymerase beta nucleotidyltransferase domain-containing protein n=2 Tax=Serinicoccus hydrothermalis TaxID=1758689 RepID=A0A1B1N923_9MICO|nr:hypothetical protein SGUI_0541 [Serinicoccus hydrothermalis]
MTHTRDGAAALARLRRALADGSLADLAERHGLALMVLFGSAADPRETSPGDLDLAVAWKSGTGTGDVVGVTSDLLALLGDGVDVLDLDRGSPVVRQRALTCGEVLLEREAGAFATRQMMAIRDHVDTAHLRRRQLELLTEPRP